MEKKEIKKEENRFTYSNNTGLKVLSEEELIESIKPEKKEDKSKEEKVEKSEESTINMQQRTKYGR